MRTDLAQRGALQNLDSLAAPFENSLFCTATSVYEFFHSNGYRLKKAEVLGRTVSQALMSQRGWVYAFYGPKEAPIYVGETQRTFMKRFKEHRKKQNWWSDWTEVKVLPCPDQTMRKVFESLVGLGGGYLANKAQPAGGDNLLDEMLLSLIALGNNNNELPSFPNKQIFDQVELVRHYLEKIDY